MKIPIELADILEEVVSAFLFDRFYPSTEYTETRNMNVIDQLKYIEQNHLVDKN